MDNDACLVCLGVVQENGFCGACGTNIIDAQLAFKNTINGAFAELRESCLDLKKCLIDEYKKWFK